MSEKNTKFSLPVLIVVGLIIVACFAALVFFIMSRRAISLKTKKSSISEFYVPYTGTGVETTKSNGWDIYKFSQNGTITIQNTATVYYVLVGGGGGGGGSLVNSTNPVGNFPVANFYGSGGGGCGGGVNYGSTTLSSGTYNINIGNGGMANISSSGQNGTPTTISLSGNVLLSASGGNGGAVAFNIVSSSPLDFIATNGSNQVLYPNDFILDNTGRYQLKYQTDGNLVMYDLWTTDSNYKNVVIWIANKTNSAPKYCKIDSVGTLVKYPSIALYDTSDKIYASISGISGTPPFKLVIQSDRNLVIYDNAGKACWATNTYTTNNPYKVNGGISVTTYGYGRGGDGKDANGTGSSGSIGITIPLTSLPVNINLSFSGGGGGGGRGVGAYVGGDPGGGNGNNGSIQGSSGTAPGSGGGGGGVTSTGVKIVGGNGTSGIAYIIIRPTDCVYNPSFSDCNSICGGGVKTGTNTIVSQPTNGGVTCPPSTLFYDTCNTNTCLDSTLPYYWFPFNNDKSSLGINTTSLSLNGTPTFSNNMLQLVSSSSQYVTIPPFPTDNIGLSFSLWFTSRSNQTWARLFDFGNGPSNNNIIMYINNGNLGLSVYLGSTYYMYDVYSTNVNNNTLTHVAWTLNPASPYTWSLYINGNSIVLPSTLTPKYPNSIIRNQCYIGRSNWSSDPYFTGSISDFRVYKRVISQTEVINIMNSNNPYNVAYYVYPLQIDISSIGINTTSLLLNGTPSPIFSDNMLQLVSSSSQYATIPPFSTDNTGLSFSLWFTSRSNQSWARLFDFGNGRDSNNIFMAINNGNLAIGVYSGAIPYQNENVYSTNVNNNTLTHVAWTLNPVSPYTWSLYVNGKLISITAPSNGYIYPSAIIRNNCYIGKSNWSFDPYFTGSISDFRVYKRVISQAEVINIMNSNVLYNTPYYYYPLQIDISSIGINTTSLSLNGTPSPTFSNNMLQLVSSSSQYVTIPPFSTDNTGLSFSLWFTSNNSQTFARLFDFGNGQDSNNIFMAINNGNLAIGVFSGSTPYQNQNVYSTNVNNNTLTHVSWTLNPVSPYTWSLYVNGKLINFASPSNGYIYPSAIIRNNCYIGKSNWSTNPYFTGSVSDFRVYKRVISQTEVINIMNSNNSSIITTVDPTNSYYIYTFNNNSSWVIPPNVNSINYCVVGGGGGGGSAYRGGGSSNMGGGGGAGGVVKTGSISVNPGDIYNINIGIGGGVNPPTQGGTTSFYLNGTVSGNSNYISSSGGGAGNSATGPTSPPSGGTNGTSYGYGSGGSGGSSAITPGNGSPGATGPSQLPGSYYGGGGAGGGNLFRLGTGGLGGGGGLGSPTGAANSGGGGAGAYMSGGVGYPSKGGSGVVIIIAPIIDSIPQSLDTYTTELIQNYTNFIKNNGIPINNVPLTDTVNLPNDDLYFTGLLVPNNDVTFSNITKNTINNTISATLNFNYNLNNATVTSQSRRYAAKNKGKNILNSAAPHRSLSVSMISTIPMSFNVLFSRLGGYPSFTSSSITSTEILLQSMASILSQLGITLAEAVIGGLAAAFALAITNIFISLKFPIQDSDSSSPVYSYLPDSCIFVPINSNNIDPSSYYSYFNVINSALNNLACGYLSVNVPAFFNPNVPNFSPSYYSSTVPNIINLSTVSSFFLPDWVNRLNNYLQSSNRPGLLIVPTIDINNFICFNAIIASSIYLYRQWAELQVTNMCAPVTGSSQSQINVINNILNYSLNSSGTNLIYVDNTFSVGGDIISYDGTIRLLRFGMPVALAIRSRESPFQDTVILSFNGSISLIDYGSNQYVDINRLIFHSAKIPTWSGSSINVAAYYSNIYNTSSTGSSSIRDKLFKYILKLLTFYNNSSSNPLIVRLVGHSLGGVLAQIVAADLILRFPNKITVEIIGFNSPAMTNNADLLNITSSSSYNKNNMINFSACIGDVSNYTNLDLLTNLQQLPGYSGPSGTLWQDYNTYVIFNSTSRPNYSTNPIDSHMLSNFISQCAVMSNSASPVSPNNLTYIKPFNDSGFKANLSATLSLTVPPPSSPLTFTNPQFIDGFFTNVFLCTYFETNVENLFLDFSEYDTTPSSMQGTTVIPIGTRVCCSVYLQTNIFPGNMTTSDVNITNLASDYNSMDVSLSITVSDMLFLFYSGCTVTPSNNYSRAGYDPKCTTITPYNYYILPTTTITVTYHITNLLNLEYTYGLSKSINDILNADNYFIRKEFIASILLECNIPANLNFGLITTPNIYENVQGNNTAHGTASFLSTPDESFAFPTDYRYSDMQRQYIQYIGSGLSFLAASYAASYMISPTLLTYLGGSTGGLAFVAVSELFTRFQQRRGSLESTMTQALTEARQMTTQAAMSYRQRMITNGYATYNRWNPYNYVIGRVGIRTAKGIWKILKGVGMQFPIASNIIGGIEIGDGVREIVSAAYDVSQTVDGAIVTTIGAAGTAVNTVSNDIIAIAADSAQPLVDLTNRMLSDYRSFFISYNGQLDELDNLINGLPEVNRDALNRLRDIATESANTLKDIMRQIVGRRETQSNWDYFSYYYPGLSTALSFSSLLFSYPTFSDSSLNDNAGQFASALKNLYLGSLNYSNIAVKVGIHFSTIISLFPTQQLSKMFIANLVANRPERFTVMSFGKTIILAALATAVEFSSLNKLAYLISFAISTLVCSMLIGYTFAFLFYIIYCIFSFKIFGYGPLLIDHNSPESYCLGGTDIPYRYYQSYPLPSYPEEGIVPISYIDTSIIVTTSITNTDNYSGTRYNTLFINIPTLIDFKNTPSLGNSITINNKRILNTPSVSLKLDRWIKCVFSTEFYYAGIVLFNYHILQQYIGEVKNLSSYLPEFMEIYGEDTATGLCTKVQGDIVDPEFCMNINFPTERRVTKLINRKFKTYYINLKYNSNATRMLFGNMSFIGVPGTTVIYKCNI